MSTQSININNIDTVSIDTVKSIADNTKKLLLQEDYRLGKGMCKEIQKHNLKLYEIIQKDNCDLNDYLLKIIKQGPDCSFEADLNITGDIESSQSAEYLYKIWLMRGNKGSYDDFLDMLFNVNVDVWSVNDW